MNHIAKKREFRKKRQELIKQAQQRELRKKRTALKRQAKQNAIMEEYGNVLKEINRLEKYLANTPSSKDDVEIIETYKKLLSKKYVIEQTSYFSTDEIIKQINEEESSQIETSIIAIEWRDIVFLDGKLTFQYHNKYYNIVATNAKEAYNKLIPFFAKRLSALEIEIKDSVAKIVNPIDFNDVVKLLQWCQTIFQIKDDITGIAKISTLNVIPAKLIRQIFPHCKTKYLNYLQDKQDEKSQIIPVFETRGQNPDGFLFTINRGNEYLIVWESNQDMANKATYVFHSPFNQLHELQQFIFDYIYSDIPNKRFNLRTNKEKEFLGFSYQCIDHNNFSSWVKHLEKSFDDIVAQKKNEHCVSYHINQNREYIPSHNIIQNKLKAYLEDTGFYKKVFIEDDNVDIKTVTFEGEWHYFELKTSTPRQCIREALGQILEYAHYPFDNRAKKLYIVGCYALSENEIKYMNLLRSIYKLPIWYRWFNETKNCLSEDF